MTRDCRLVKRIDIFKLLSFSSTVIGHLQDDITWLHLPESLVVFMCKMGLLFSKSQREGQILMRRQKWILGFVVKPTSSWNWPIKSVQQQKGKFFFFSNWAYHARKSCLISEGPVFSCHLSSLVYKTQVWLKNSGAFLSRIFCFCFVLVFFFFVHFRKEAVQSVRTIPTEVLQTT